MYDNETGLTFDPVTELRHRCRVYPFGIRWHWKCNDYGCRRGGPARTQQDAINRAERHAEHQGQEID